MHDKRVSDNQRQIDAEEELGSRIEALKSNIVDLLPHTLETSLVNAALVLEELSGINLDIFTFITDQLDDRDKGEDEYHMLSCCLVSVERFGDMEEEEAEFLAELIANYITSDEFYLEKINERLRISS